MQSQIDKVEFTGHLILTEAQVRVLNAVSQFSWSGFVEEKRLTEFNSVKYDLLEETGKLIKKFDEIRAAELGKKS